MKQWKQWSLFKDPVEVPAEKYNPRPKPKPKKPKEVQVNLDPLDEFEKPLDHIRRRIETKTYFDPRSHLYCMEKTYTAKDGKRFGISGSIPRHQKMNHQSTLEKRLENDLLLQVSKHLASLKITDGQGQGQ